MSKTSKRSQPNMDIPAQAPSQPILLNSTLSLPPVSLEPYPQKQKISLNILMFQKMLKSQKLIVLC